MGVKRGTQFEGFGRTRKLVEAKQIPFLSSGFSHIQFISRYMEGGALPAVGCFYLNQAIAPVRCKAGYVKACTVAFLPGHPANTLGEIAAALLPELKTLVMKHQFFSGVTQCLVAFVASRNVEASGDSLHFFEFLWRRCVPKGWSNPDKQGRGFCHSVLRQAMESCCPIRMLRKPA